MRGKLLALLGAAAMFALPTAANAVVYGFDNITNNSATDAAIGEAQLTVDVTQSGSIASFTFMNSGPAASSITDIYFDWSDPVLLTFSGLVQGSGVSYSVGASPGNLPGGNPVGFDADFGADSNTPTQPSGINPGEFLTINFTNSGSFADLLAQLDSDALNIGIHVQGFLGGGSESFVETPPTTPVPEPGMIGLIGLGLLGLGLARRCKG